MSVGTHETLVHRLAQILIRLNQGEKIDPGELANEFGVSLRTIQRDLNERFSYLPLLRTNGKYHIDSAVLGKLTTKDILRFSGLAGVQGLFPSLGEEFFRDIFDSRIQDALLVRGHNYENLAGHERIFTQLKRAIIRCQQISVRYQSSSGSKEYPSLLPYKLINTKGIWYLAATDNGKLKTFALTKIQRLTALDAVFQHAPETQAVIREQDGIWLSETPFDVVLKVSKDVSSYFKRRKLLANQFVEKELEDGSMLISTKVGHVNQIIPIVRYWIPHIRIVSPESLQNNLEKSLADYLTGNSESIENQPTI